MVLVTFIYDFNSIQKGQFKKSSLLGLVMVEEDEKVVERCLISNKIN